MAKKSDIALDIAAVAASKPQAVAQPPVVRVPMRVMRKFACDDVASLSNGTIEYVAHNGYIELPADESWYASAIEAGLLKEEV